MLMVATTRKRMGGFIKDTIAWSNEEIEILRSLGKEGQSPSVIQKHLPGRTGSAVRSKIRLVKLNEGWYNKDHIQEKYAVNNHFVKRVRPESVCDAFAGETLYYNNYQSNIPKITTNDTNKRWQTEYHMDAKKFLALMVEKNKSFDIVDIDPFGSSAKYVDDAIKLATKGLVVSIGDFCFKLNTKVSVEHAKMYGYEANSGKDITMDNIVRAIQRKARSMGKELKVFDQRLWGAFGRVWFLVRPIGRVVQEQSGAPK